MAPSWSTGGTEVTLKASIDGGGNGAEYALPANYTFSWVSLTDAGTPPRWFIANANQPTASVYLPIIEGPPQRLDFQVTATTNAPLTPGSTSATLSALVLDRQPPRLTGTSTNSIMGTVLDFSEPMNEDPTSCLMNTPNGTCSVTLSTGALRTVGKLYRNNRALYITRPPFPGELWSFRLSTVPTDVEGNNLPPTLSQDFLPVHVWTPTYLVMTGDAVATSARPDPTNTLTNHLVRVFGSNGTDALAVSSGLMNQCSTAPCPTTTTTIGASPTTSLVRPTTFTIGSTSYYQPEPGLVFVSDGGTGSEVLPAAPGTVFGYTRQPALHHLRERHEPAHRPLRRRRVGRGERDHRTERWTRPHHGRQRDVGRPQHQPFVLHHSAHRHGRSRATRSSSGSAFGQPLYNNPPLSLFAVKQAWVYASSAEPGCHVAFIGTDDKPAVLRLPRAWATSARLATFSSRPRRWRSPQMARDSRPLAERPGGGRS